MGERSIHIKEEGYLGSWECPRKRLWWNLSPLRMCPFPSTHLENSYMNALFLETSEKNWLEVKSNAGWENLSGTIIAQCLLEVAPKELHAVDREEACYERTVAGSKWSFGNTGICGCLLLLAPACSLARVAYLLYYILFKLTFLCSVWRQSYVVLYNMRACYQ